MNGKPIQVIRGRVVGVHHGTHSSVANIITEHGDASVLVPLSFGGPFEAARDKQIVVTITEEEVQ